LSQAISETIASRHGLNRRKDYVHGLELYLNAFARGRESMPVHQFGPKQIEAWFNSRNEAATTRNSNLGRLSALFGHCWRKGYIAENPCKRVEAASVDKHTPTTLNHRQYLKAVH